MNKRLKIAIVGPAHPYRGGLASIMETMAREYQSRGYEVHILTFTLQYPADRGYTSTRRPQHTTQGLDHKSAIVVERRSRVVQDEARHRADEVLDTIYGAMLRHHCSPCTQEQAYEGHLPNR